MSGTTSSQQGGGFGSLSSNTDKVFYSTTNTIPSVAPTDGIDTHVLLNGTRYDWDGTQWIIGTKNLITLNKATGLTSNVNGVVSTVTTPVGTITDIIGYNSAGNPVNQTAASLLAGATTHTLASSVNVMTSVVNGISATAPIINSNVLTPVAVGKLTSTVNGVVSAPIDILAGNFDNDLGIGADGKVETGFPLHRNTFTSGGFYREWNNNQTGVTGTGSGLVYGLNNFGLGSGYWDKALIGQGAFTSGYYNTVTGAYSGAIGQQNVITGYASFGNGYANTVSNTYSQAFGYAGNNAGYISSILGGNSNKIQAGNYHNVGGGYDNIISVGNYNLIGEGSSNRNNGGSYASIQNGAGNTVSAAYNTVGNGSSNTISTQNYATIGNGSSNVLTGGYSTIGNGSGNNVAGSYNTNINGSNNLIDGSYNVGAGSSLNILGSYNYGNGYAHVMTGTYNGAFGYLQKVNGSYNFATGYNSDLSAASFGNTVSGYSHIVTGDRGVIGGNANTYAGQYGAMFGNSNTMAAGRYGSLISGASNQQLGGWNSALLGEGNLVEAASQYTKILGGYYNTAKANTHVTFALGQQNIIGNATGTLTNYGAGALGGANTVIGTGSIAIGMNNLMSGTGSYNYTLGYNNSTTGAADQNVLIGQSATSSRNGTVTIKASGQRVNITTLPAYATAAAANADATLIAGDLYTITSGAGKQLMIK